jgi:hypothetical protein
LITLPPRRVRRGRQSVKSINTLPACANLCREPRSLSVRASFKGPAAPRSPWP